MPYQQPGPEVTNNETTGETSVCTKCKQPIEHALLLKNFRGSPGTPTWRTLDRGHACIPCPRGDRHTPGRITKSVQA